MHDQPYYTEESTDLFPDQELVYAGFGDRLGAVILDTLILLVPNLLFEYVVGGIAGTFLSLITNWLYFAAMESGESQATIGKKALGIKVVDLEGERISFAQATGRHFGKIISTLILLIGYFMMLWTEKKQTLHDVMASTLVVKR